GRLGMASSWNCTPRLIFDSANYRCLNGLLVGFRVRR
ncbi:MAG: hypothetical protein ACI9SE_003093, partial [Neolewinella sp.]